MSKKDASIFIIIFFIIAGFLFYICFLNKTIIVIDGNAKDWKNYSEIKVPSKSGGENDFKLAYDDKNLYVFATVPDKTPWKHSNAIFPWKGDAIEIWLDFDLGNNACGLTRDVLMINIDGQIKHNRSCVGEDTYQFVFGSNGKMTEFMKWGVNKENLGVQDNVKLIPDLNYTITHQNNLYHYEISIPRNYIKEFSPENNAVVAVGLIINGMANAEILLDGEPWVNERTYWPKGYMWGNPETFQTIEIKKVN